VNILMYKRYPNNNLEYDRILNYYLDTSCTFKSTSAQTSHKSKIDNLPCDPPNLKFGEDPQDISQSH